MNTRKGLNESVNQYFETFELSDSQFEQLEALTLSAAENDLNEINDQVQNESYTQSRPSDKGRITSAFKWNRIGALAAIFLLIAVGIAGYHHEHQQEKLIMTIVEEVARNHLKMKPLDIETQDFPVLRSALDKLEFWPNPSNYFDDNEKTLLGARYCSILSVPAAQIRYQQNMLNSQTLYQVAFSVDKFGEIPDVEKGESPIVRYLLGLKVEIWQEKGLLMVSSVLASNEER